MHSPNHQMCFLPYCFPFLFFSAVESLWPQTTNHFFLLTSTPDLPCFSSHCWALTSQSCPYFSLCLWPERANGFNPEFKAYSGGSPVSLSGFLQLLLNPHLCSPNPPKTRLHWLLYLVVPSLSSGRLWVFTVCWSCSPSAVWAVCAHRFVCTPHQRRLSREPDGLRKTQHEGNVVCEQCVMGI